MQEEEGGTVRDRLASLRRHGAELEADGVPFPTEQVGRTVDELLDGGSEEKAAQVLKRGETLLAVAARDWAWIKQSLERADELRALATEIGLDVGHLDTRVGNPRAELKGAPLSAGSLSRAAASASLSVAVLSDAIPKHCVEEGQKLGGTIRTARNRGEDVASAVREFSLLLAAIQDQHPVAMSRALIATRHAVARIPRAPTMGALPNEEEEEILVEARNLARRLHRIKGRARNAQSAARLMTQVRAALSEDRRFGTPEEEIEALWSEVDRLTRERARSAGEDPLPGEAGAPEGTPDEGAAPDLASPEADGPPVDRPRPRGRP